MMSASATHIAVMDADLQHDEMALPRMLEMLQEQGLDVVVGTRNASGGSMGQFSRTRLLLSRFGQRISQSVCCCRLTDPMSGFFMVRRGFLLEVVRDLQDGGFKILVDMLASSRRPVRLGEVGYTFRQRRHGESKLDVLVGMEYLFLIINKRLDGLLPVELALYLMVGALGLLTHLIVLLSLTREYHASFVTAQVVATFVAMSENFFLNNAITYRHRRYRGARLLVGGSRFLLVCSFGAWANVIFARALLQSGMELYLAGLAGVVLGSVWNLSISSLFTWQAQRRGALYEEAVGIFAEDAEVYR